jgi:beta-phosphoglucomutase-like phosphatase (HAD superfamily)
LARDFGVDGAEQLSRICHEPNAFVARTVFGLRKQIGGGEFRIRSVVSENEDFAGARQKVDGNVADELGLAGKPAPDGFLEAARRLGVEPRSAAVFEDALAGVAAGRTGGFGFVVGVDRGGQAAELRAHGADVVVSDLADLIAAP